MIAPKRADTIKNSRLFPVLIATTDRRKIPRIYTPPSRVMLKESGIHRRLTWSLRSEPWDQGQCDDDRNTDGRDGKENRQRGFALACRALGQQDEQRRQAEQSQRGKKFPGGLSFPE